MSIVRRFAKNTVFLFLATLFTNVSAFIWTLYIARYIGATDFGLLSMALALTGILSVLMDMGLCTYTTREISKYPERTSTFLANVASIKIILSAISLTLLYLIVIMRGYDLISMQVTFLIGFYMVLTSFSNMFNAIFQAYQRMEYQTIGNILNSSILLVGIFLVIYLKGNIIDISLAYVIAAISTFLYSIYICNIRFARPSLSVHFDFWKNILAEAIPFGVTNIFANIYFWIDSVMLSFMKGDFVVGIYNAPYKFLLVLLSIYNVYMVALFPLMSKFYKDSRKALEISYQRSLKYMLMFSIPIAIAITILAQDIILFIYGQEYLAGVGALQILTWTIVFMFINGVSSNLLGSIERQVTVTKITGIGALFNLVINLILIPTMSFIGASISTVLTELLITILLYRAVSKTGYLMGLSLNEVNGIIIPSILMAISLFYLKTQPLLFFIPILIYIGGLYLLGAIDEMDIKLMKEVIKPLTFKVKDI